MRALLSRPTPAGLGRLRLELRAGYGLAAAGYRGIRSIANEDGSDGTVRVSTANMSCVRIGAQFRANPDHVGHDVTYEPETLLRLDRVRRHRRPHPWRDHARSRRGGLSGHAGTHHTRPHAAVARRRRLLVTRRRIRRVMRPAPPQTPDCCPAPSHADAAGTAFRMPSFASTTSTVPASTTTRSRSTRRTTPGGSPSCSAPPRCATSTSIPIALLSERLRRLHVPPPHHRPRGRVAEPERHRVPRARRTYVRCDTIATFPRPFRSRRTILKSVCSSRETTRRLLPMGFRTRHQIGCDQGNSRPGSILSPFDVFAEGTAVVGDARWNKRVGEVAMACWMHAWMSSAVKSG